MDSGHARIDVSVNESYDGSYSGNPHDLTAQPLGLAGSSGGSAFGRQGPTRRSAITAMIVWRPHRLRAAGHDPLNLEVDDTMEVCETQRPFITGHNRCAICSIVEKEKNAHSTLYFTDFLSVKKRMFPSMLLFLSIRLYLCFGRLTLPAY